MTLCDVRSDNYHALVVADLCPLLADNTDGRSRLKVFKGTTLVNEQPIAGIPAAVISLYIDENGSPKVPGMDYIALSCTFLNGVLIKQSYICITCTNLVVALAVGPSVLFYRNMKPYYKWTLPSLPINETETEIWRKLPTDKAENIPLLVDRLRQLDARVLTQVSLDLMEKPSLEVDVRHASYWVVIIRI